MSFPMDDIGLSYVTKRPQANSSKTRIVDTPSNSNSVSSNQTNEAEDVVVSENIQNRNSANDDKTLENIQNAGGILDTAQNGLSNIMGFLNDTKSQLEKGMGDNVSSKDWSDINSSIKKDLESIQKVVKDTSFNDINPLDGSSLNKVSVDTKINGIINISSEFGDTSLDSLGLTDTSDVSVSNKEYAGVILDKVNKAIDNVQTKQKKISESKDSLDKTADSFLSSVSKSIKENVTFAENLKKTAMKGLLVDPEVTMQAQIKAIDDRMIMALLYSH